MLLRDTTFLYQTLRMVLTRLSHFGEVCPLSDHSYSDPAATPSSSTSHQPNKRFSVREEFVRIAVFSLIANLSSLLKVAVYFGVEVGCECLSCQSSREIGLELTGPGSLRVSDHQGNWGRRALIPELFHMLMLSLISPKT